MTSFHYDVTGDIIYIWAVTLTPAKLGILNNQCERIWYPPILPIDVGNGTYLQGLNSLYKISGKTMENSDIGITRETYQQGYTLIGFDVDPTTSPDLGFKNGLPSPVTVILYATFPEIMTIDQARNVPLEIKDKFAQRRERSQG